MDIITMVSANIEKYAVDHTTPLPDHLEALKQYTMDNMASAGMLSGPIEGTLLQFLVWATGAKRVLEIGCFTGFSAQMMASALPDDGTLTTCEIDPKVAAIAQEHLDRSPDGHKIDIRVGPALETLESLDGPFDLVFIDADKTSYVDYYERAMAMLSDRGIIAIDNVLWSGRVLSPKDDSDRAIAALNDRISRDPRVRHVLLPIRDGVMLVHKRGTEG